MFIFGNILGKHLVNSLNAAFDIGELSVSQRQAVVTLLEKKDKVRTKLQNWRPISLLNVDTKIGRKP